MLLWFKKRSKLEQRSTEAKLLPYQVCYLCNKLVQQSTDVEILTGLSRLILL
jgi:hypothetical protein